MRSNAPFFLLMISVQIIPTAHIKNINTFVRKKYDRVSVTFSACVYNLFKILLKPEKTKYTVRNQTNFLPELNETSFITGRTAAVNIKREEMISLKLTGSLLISKPKSIGIIIAPAEPIMEVRVIDMREYAYMEKNSDAAERQPKKNANISVKVVVLTTHPFAKNKQTQATIALIKFA